MWHPRVADGAAVDEGAVVVVVVVAAAVAVATSLGCEDEHPTTITTAAAPTVQLRNPLVRSIPLTAGRAPRFSKGRRLSGAGASGDFDGTFPYVPNTSVH